MGINARLYGAVLVCIAGGFCGLACSKTQESPPQDFAARPASVAEENKRIELTGSPRWPTTPEASAASASPPMRAERRDPAADTADRAAIEQAIQAALQGLGSCFTKPGSWSVVISIEATAAGRAENIRVSGSDLHSQRCISDRVTSWRLPTFTGKALNLQIPFKVTRQVSLPAQVPDPEPSVLPPGSVVPVPSAGAGVTLVPSYVPSTLPSGDRAPPMVPAYETGSVPTGDRDPPHLPSYEPSTAPTTPTQDNSQLGQQNFVQP